MASNYPGSLDSFDTIASDKKTSDAVGGRTHRQMHNDLGDATESVQAELGTDPAGTFSTVKARLDQLVAYAAKTGAYTATVADHTLNVTSGTFTLDLPAASTCTGQSLRVKNSGTGVVTLDGNSSETIEGVATFPLGPRSYVEITSTGSAWILTAGVPDSGWRRVLLWNASGTVTEGTSPDAGWDLTTGAGAGSIKVRRRGSLVMLLISGTVYCPTSGAPELLKDLPTTFQMQGTIVVRCGSGNTLGLEGSYLGRAGNTFWPASSVALSNPVAAVLPAVSEDWPASLPGVPA